MDIRTLDQSMSTSGKDMRLIKITSEDKGGWDGLGLAHIVDDEVGVRQHAEKNRTKPRLICLLNNNFFFFQNQSKQNICLFSSVLHNMHIKSSHFFVKVAVIMLI